MLVFQRILSVCLATYKFIVTSTKIFFSFDSESYQYVFCHILVISESSYPLQQHYNNTAASPVTLLAMVHESLPQCMRVTRECGVHCGLTALLLSLQDFQNVLDGRIDACSRSLSLTFIREYDSMHVAEILAGPFCKSGMYVVFFIVYC